MQTDCFATTTLLASLVVCLGTACPDTCMSSSTFLHQDGRSFSQVIFTKYQHTTRHFQVQPYFLSNLLSPCHDQLRATMILRRTYLPAVNPVLQP